MSDAIKTVAAIHDLSGFGRCSLSVISPVLSVMGIQTIAVPTAVLSAHTGYGDIAIHDLTDYMQQALESYKKIGVNPNCIYTGFLGSEKQINHCLDFFSSYENALKVVDPVMGDDGKPYRTYTKEMCHSVKRLVKKADIITPNKTEMYILLNQEYNPLPLNTIEAKSCLVKLSELGPKQVVITGIELSDMTVNNLGYDSETNRFWRVRCSYVPQNYPGTGDTFASVVVGSILNGDSLAIAMEMATRFLELTIKTTYSFGTDPKQGIMLEKNLAWLTRRHSLDGYENL